MKTALPGCTDGARKVLTHRLLAITGDRFINAGTMTMQRRSSACTAPLQGESLRKRARRSASTPPLGTPLVQPALADTGPDPSALDMIADTIDGSAPAVLSIDDAIAYTQAAKYCHAGVIQRELPRYFLPLLCSLDTAQVRMQSCRQCVLQCTTSVRDSQDADSIRVNYKATQW